MGNFKTDLKKGNFSEKRVAVILRSRGNQITSFNNNSKHDFSFVNKNGEIYTVEVKSDYKFKETGNIVIEFECNSKPSGIDTSKADFWCFVLNGEYYMCELPVLRQHLRKNHFRYRKVKGGDKYLAYMYVIPFEQIKDLFNKMGVKL